MAAEGSLPNFDHIASPHVLAWPGIYVVSWLWVEVGWSRAGRAAAERPLQLRGSLRAHAVPAWLDVSTGQRDGD